MKKYVKEIKKYPLLNKHEEFELFEQFYSGSSKAYSTLIESNLLNTYNIAYTFHLDQEFMKGCFGRPMAL